MAGLPTNVYNAKGEAILSWRVLLLPYLEQNNLYQQFKLDEPWDSENNKKAHHPDAEGLRGAGPCGAEGDDLLPGLCQSRSP